MTDNSNTQTTGAEQHKKPKLLEQVRNEIRVRHYSIRTERSYLNWIKQYILFHNKRHPRELSEIDITAFLTHLAVDRKVATSTQNQALCAIIFLYSKVLKMEVNKLGNIVRPKYKRKLPVVLSVRETERIFQQLRGPMKLMLVLLYATGVRLIELIRLRVKDIDFENHFIIVRSGKGDKDRSVILPKDLEPFLKEQIRRVKLLHDKDLSEGFGTVYLPHALEKKYPNTNKEFAWQYLFPSKRISTDPRSGRRQRHHVYESVLQKSIKQATRAAEINKPVHAHIRSHVQNDSCSRTDSLIQFYYDNGTRNRTGSCTSAQTCFGRVSIMVWHI